MHVIKGAIYVHETVSARLSIRLHEDELDLAKTLWLEDGADVGFESFGSKSGHDSMSSKNPSRDLLCSHISSKIGVTGNRISYTLWERWKDCSARQPNGYK